MGKNVLIVNYNTNILTQCCIKSVNKFTPGCKIYVFDNSDTEPFVNVFDNVEVIDNTKHQIIDFGKWLQKYPNRYNSVEKTQTYASAKHTYTIQTFMDMFDDDFVLLDSDVLLKKNISDIWDDKYIYVAQVINQTPRIKRVLPFICFINNKLCKENNVHFFNENRMHGLAKCDIVRDGDFYDTGANFYIEAQGFPHREINNSDYVEHYKGGSWEKIHNKLFRKDAISSETWLEKNKFLWS